MHFYTFTTFVSFSRSSLELSGAHQDFGEDCNWLISSEFGLLSKLIWGPIRPLQFYRADSRKSRIMSHDFSLEKVGKKIDS